MSDYLLRQVREHEQAIAQKHAALAAKYSAGRSPQISPAPTRDRWTSTRPCPWLPPQDLKRMTVNPRGIRRHDVCGDRARVPG